MAPIDTDWPTVEPAETLRKLLLSVSKLMEKMVEKCKRNAGTSWVSGVRLHKARLKDFER